MQDRKDAFTSSLRLNFIILAFLAISFLVFIRLFSWQIVKSSDLSVAGRLQQRSTVKVGAQRGSILAKDYFPLTLSTQAWLIFASLPDLKEPVDEMSSKLAPLLVEKIEVNPEEKIEFTTLEKLQEEAIKLEKERIASLLSRQDVVWVPIKHKVDTETKKKIEGLGIPGIGFDPEDARTYPEGSMSAHLIGFVGKDQAGLDQGYFGLEGKYDVALSGREGRSVWEHDAQGNPIITGLRRDVQALNGVNIVTHIDRSIQFLIETKLGEAMEKYGAAGGTVIVMRPNHGAVLGMASLPAYDPVNFSKYQESDFINPAISQSFEPGSVFKILVMAAALDSGSVKPDMKCECTGPRTIAEYTIGTWDDKYYPDSTPKDIIQHSDNVGMIWVGEKLGKENMYKYLSDFGIGSLTGIDLQGEATPKLREKDSWGQVDLATASFGQGIAVTPIQMIRAAAVIANKGRLPVPQVVDKISGLGWEEDIEKNVGQNVISQETAEQITEMMVQAVKAGEAKWAAPRGFSIAGKTGTAQIPVAGHYDIEKTIASFVGFAPATNPAFIMLVTLREPKSSPWASETAAPLWFSIAKDLFPHLGVKPN